LVAVILLQVSRLRKLDEAAAIGFDRMNPRAAVTAGALRQGSECPRSDGRVLLEGIIGVRIEQWEDLFVPRSHCMESAGDPGKEVLSGDPELVEILLPDEVVETLRVRRIPSRHLAINPELNRFD
jgi:hypothetical protein